MLFSGENAEKGDVEKKNSIKAIHFIRAILVWMG